LADIITLSLFVVVDYIGTACPWGVTNLWALCSW